MFKIKNLMSKIKISTGVMYGVVPTINSHSIAFLDWIARTHPEIERINELSSYEIDALREEFKRLKLSNAEASKRGRAK